MVIINIIKAALAFLFVFSPLYFNTISLEGAAADKVESGSSPVPLSDGYYTNELENTSQQDKETMELSLSEFKVSKGDNALIISWNVDTVFEKEIFGIDKSTDGLNYYSIAEVQTSYSCGGKEHLSISDTNIAFNTIYYRLKHIITSDISQVIDFDVVTSDADEILEKLAYKPEIICKGSCVLSADEMYIDEQGKMKFFVYDVLGNVISVTAPSVGVNDYTTSAFDNALAPGIFVFRGSGL